jgi:hypothetical protein
VKRIADVLRDVVGTALSVVTLPLRALAKLFRA